MYTQSGAACSKSLTRIAPDWFPMAPDFSGATERKLLLVVDDLVVGLDHVIGRLRAR